MELRLLDQRKLWEMETARQVETSSNAGPLQTNAGTADAIRQQQTQAAETQQQISFGTVDVKPLSKLEKFSGLPGDWKGWSSAFRASIGHAHADAAEALTWAASQTEGITAEDISRDEQAQLLHSMDGHIYTALGLLLLGDATDEFRQVPMGDGLEAWRRIVAFYRMSYLGRKSQVLRDILYPKPVPGQTTLCTVRFWEERLSKYEKRYHELIDQDAKTGAFIQLMPNSLREHMYTNLDQYVTYERLREAGCFYLQSGFYLGIEGCPA